MKQTVDELRKTRAYSLALSGRHIGPTADPYIRSIVSPSAKRTCGPNFADRIERALNLPAGWLSQTHDENEFRAGLYVIDAAGARLVGQLTINLAGAQFTVDADTVPADTVKFVGRVVGIIKRIP